MQNIHVKHLYFIQTGIETFMQKRVPIYPSYEQKRKGRKIGNQNDIHPLNRNIMLEELKIDS